MAGDHAPREYGCSAVKKDEFSKDEQTHCCSVWMKRTSNLLVSLNLLLVHLVQELLRIGGGFFVFGQVIRVGVH